MSLYIILAITAFFASLLTFFSGFGLGTLLMIAFAFFFPINTAIAVTAIIHLANNIFKFALVRKDVNILIALRFGIPAILGALIGSYLLISFEDFVLAKYSIGENQFTITLLKTVIALLLVFFAIIELLPNFKLQFGKRHLLFGGLLSGFFGGLSGHQGALRTAFLIKYNLAKEAFIATGIVIAFFIDVSRLSVYYNKFLNLDFQTHFYPILVASLFAFSGAVLGKFLLKKITFRAVQLIISVMIIIFSVALALGLVDKKHEKERTQKIIQTEEIRTYG